MGNITILLYHQVGNTVHENTNLDCFCETSNFINQMQAIKDSGIQVIALKEALKLLKGTNKLTNNYVVLTFDDGCERFYTLIHPILKKYNYPSTIYPVVGSLGKVATWCNPINPDLKIMSTEQIITLANEGVEIGAHSVNHYKLDLLDWDDCALEIEQSKIYLENLLNKKIKSFSYPHGRFNEKMVDFVQQIGFENAVTCKNDFAQNTTSFYELPRKYVTYNDNTNSILKKIC